MNEREIFIEALQQADATQRSAYLDRVCGQDTRLRERVEVLLVREAGSSFLDRPAAEIAVTVGPRQVSEKAGDAIGVYKLREQIGEGGMGVVYMATQKEPVRRTVALKIIKPGMDSQQVVARFEAERQALAMMNHPNIAKILDAGTTHEGRPYFVMELVKGLPITTTSEQQNLSVNERLQLFVTVCRAVQHAHQKGVIHRDIKPSNVMAELHDVEVVPKVIDFGVAKATNQELSDHSLHTGFGQMVGTPLYMSPEQAQLSGLDIDTRSDVYSLGVLLYELLTGSTPFDRETLKKVGFDEMRRMIREDDPPRPSERLSTLATAQASTVTVRRGVERTAVGEELPGRLGFDRDEGARKGPHSTL